MHDEHTHEHNHEHTHDHPHEHHTHEQHHTHSGGQPTGDTARTIALLRYMLEHNRQHASELSAAGEKLYGDGLELASELIADAVHYFDHGNEMLAEAVKILGGEG